MKRRIDLIFIQRLKINKWLKFNTSNSVTSDMPKSFNYSTVKKNLNNDKKNPKKAFICWLSRFCRKKFDVTVIFAICRTKF
jgi:hypothetical protein